MKNNLKCPTGNFMILVSSNQTADAFLNATVRNRTANEITTHYDSVNSFEPSTDEFTTNGTVGIKRVTSTHISDIPSSAPDVLRHFAQNGTFQ